MIRTGTPTTNRGGFTLIELLVVITGVTVALGLSVSLIHLLLKLDRSHRDLAETTSISRLADQFRQDVRAAEGKKGAEPDHLALTLADNRTIHYEAHAGSLNRLERRADEVVRRETYRLPGTEAPRFQVREDQGDVWIRIVLVSSTAASSLPTGPSRAVPIEALMGKDRKLAVLGGSTR